MYFGLQMLSCLGQIGFGGTLGDAEHVGYLVVLITFYGKQVKHHAVGRGKRLNEQQYFLSREMVQGVRLVAHMKKFYIDCLRSVLPLSVVVDSGTHQYLVQPRFERKLKIIVGANFLKHFDKGVIEHFVGFLFVLRVAHADFHTVAVELPVEFSLTSRFPLLAGPNDVSEFCVQSFFVRP